MGWFGNGGMGGWMGGLFMVLFWAVFIVLVVLAILQLTRQGMGSAPRETMKRDPVDVLRERYAKGEIDTEEFEERMRVLGKRER